MAKECQLKKPARRETAGFLLGDSCGDYVTLALAVAMLSVGALEWT